MERAILEKDNQHMTARRIDSEPWAECALTRRAFVADLGKKGEHQYGYLVTFRVNSRNRFGASTGMQTHGALIRDGEVIKGVGFGF